MCVYGRLLASRERSWCPSSSHRGSNIFFSLTGVCGGPRNSSAHIATFTSVLFHSLHPHFTIQSDPPPPPPPSHFLSFVSFSSNISPSFLHWHLESRLKKNEINKKPGKWPQMKKSALEKRIWASDIIEVLVLRYRNMLKRHHGQWVRVLGGNTAVWWRLCECRTDGSRQQRLFMNEWICVT